MGVEWEWRKAFYDAAASRKDASRTFAGSNFVLRALAGDLTLAVQAWTTQDIRTAVFLKEEIERELGGHPRMIIDAAAEAWKEPELLVRSKVAVVLPPFPPGGARVARARDRSWPGTSRASSTTKAFPIALSSHGLPGIEDRLPMQAAYAMRGGLSFGDALDAVTIMPARMLGVENRVGSIEVGRTPTSCSGTGRRSSPDRASSE